MIRKASMENLLISALIVICCVYIFFRPIIKVDNIMCMAILLLAIGSIVTKRNGLLLERNTFTGLWPLCVLWMIISCTHTYSIVSGIKVILVMSTFLICGILLMATEDWFPLFTKVSLIFIALHGAFTVFQVVAPKQALLITGFLLSPGDQALTREWIEQNGTYAGMAGQTFVNAFFFSILFGFALSRFLTAGEKRGKLGYFVLILFSAGLIILTGKKGTLLAVACSMAVILLVDAAIRRNWESRLIMSLGIFGCVGAILVTVKTSGQQFADIMGSSVISRERIMYNAKLVFRNHAWFGSGTDSLAYYIGHSAHNNVYQLLCEYGIIGTIVFLLVILTVLIDVFDRTWKHFSDNSGYDDGSADLIFCLFYGLFLVFNGMTENTLFQYQFFLTYVLLMARAYQVTGADRYCKLKGNLYES
ncbi:MAG: O-antigen ligase family protein [Mobilibacterium timonense]|uniref:O-antigen ligase family protein n=1 Tax=Mobilibacterium timonense TaxID=1871012 RepID=UPI0023526439|nr:O-antigen ligase family protein [Mobilibacterium timonense]MBM6990290.1 O-antigen ligase family protein [Mobilibacterium timonense]